MVLHLDIQLSISLFLCFIPLLCFFLVNLKKHAFKINPIKIKDSKVLLPRSYPFIGSYFSIVANKDRRIQWTSDVIKTAPTLTFTLRRPLGLRQIFTANPAVVEHILKTSFHIYQKGDFSRMSLSDFLGDGIFNINGPKWKFQRQISSHEFSTKSLRRFVEVVVETELSERLIPILSEAAKSGSTIDLQDILQRFAFDNICKIAFGYDPKYLLPSLPHAEFAVAFENATRISGERVNSPFPIVWKIKRLFDVGSERQFRMAVNLVRDYAKEIIEEKKRELEQKSSLCSVDILSRFLTSGISDEDFITDVVISFILAGRDTTSAALTWFFWLIFGNPEVEKEILTEIREKSEAPVYEGVKEMVYTHASLCESMRLYPPVPVDSKEAVVDDVLPDGTAVRKGDRVAYHPYAMGRIEEVWGPNWDEFRPERWLEREDTAAAGRNIWKFVGRDAYTYPVFQAGPRVCLGKEMAFLQMKRVVAGVLRLFRVIPAIEGGAEPVFVATLTSKMKGGFPVRIQARASDYSQKE